MCPWRRGPARLSAPLELLVSVCSSLQLLCASSQVSLRMQQQVAHLRQIPFHQAAFCSAIYLHMAQTFEKQ